MVLKTFNLGKKRNFKSRSWIQIGFLIPHNPLTNFEIQKYYQNEPRFNRVCYRDNLPNKIKEGTYVINLVEHF